MQSPQKGADRYAALSVYRESYLRRARDCSSLTLPSLIPRDEVQNREHGPDIDTPYQSLGSHGTNNLSAKLLLGLFPPNIPFFKLRVPEGLRQQMQDGGEEGQQLASQIDKALASIERSVMRSVEARGLRSRLGQLFLHLIVGGNALMHLDDKLQLRVFPLDSYVARRTPRGRILEIIVKEMVHPSLLGEMSVKHPSVSGDLSKEDAEVATYYVIQRVMGKDEYSVHQEYEGQIIEGTEGSYKEAELPWYAFRWKAVDGEHYGRGRVEEYLGDLSSLEGLTQAVVEGTAAMSRFITMVDPNGTTRLRDVAGAPNNAVIAGRADEVTAFQANKFADFKTPYELISFLERRVSQAFLLFGALQRDAERVTAAEVRLLAQELEDALGGVYSVLAAELQTPIVRRILAVLERTGEISPIPNGVEPIVTGGIEALGRGHEVQKMMTWAEVMGNTVGPEEVKRSIDVSKYGNWLASQLTLDGSTFMKTSAQIETEIAQEREAAMQQQAVGPAIQAAARAAGQQQ